VVGEAGPWSVGPFRWTQAGGVQLLGSLSSSSSFGVANGVSADGSVVVGESYNGTNYEAFRWTQAGGMQGLGVIPGDFESRAYGVSADGSVVVGQSDSSEAFRWTQAGGMQGLGDLAGGGFYSYANGVSADGSVIVGWGSVVNGDEAFRWTSTGGMQGLGFLPGAGDLWSLAYGVSADGSVVVGNSGSYPGYVGEAFRWTQAGGMQSVADWLASAGVSVPSGWSSLNAYGVSADGSVVVGVGDSPAGTQAWIAQVTPVPLPATFWLFGSGLVGLIGFARRKKRVV